MAGTSPYGNHGEVEAAESHHEDFVHKLKVCLKELEGNEGDEKHRWLKNPECFPKKKHGSHPRGERADPNFLHDVQTTRENKGGFVTFSFVRGWTLDVGRWAFPLATISPRLELPFTPSPASLTKFLHIYRDRRVLYFHFAAAFHFALPVAPLGAGEDRRRAGNADQSRRHPRGAAFYRYRCAKQNFRWRRKAPARGIERVRSSC